MNRIGKKIVIVIVALLSSFVAAGPTQYKVFVVPVAQDGTKQWNVLAGHSPAGTWDGFVLQERRGHARFKEATRALQYQTNEVYTTQITDQTPHVVTSNGDSIYFVTVPFKTVETLNASAVSNFKNGFAWIPVSQILQSTNGVMKEFKGKNNPVTKEFIVQFKTYWPQVKDKIENK